MGRNTRQSPVPDDVLRFLREVSAARSGLTLSPLDLHGRHPYWGALKRGLVRAARIEAFLTDAGARAIGAEGYQAQDPRTWSGQTRVRFYSHGMCHVMAIALHRRTGLPIWVVRDPHP